nr:MAG TPA: hypothetical protein [Caudoviricetes sp.]
MEQSGSSSGSYPEDHRFKSYLCYYSPTWRNKCKGRELL